MSLSSRKLFPALRDNDIVYLDHAATTQVPQVVLEEMRRYEMGGRGNPGRGLHAFAERATGALEEARRTVAAFVSAAPERLVFTKSTTESLNLIAHALGSFLGSDDEVVLTVFEHHSSLLPWRSLAEERGFTLKLLPFSHDGTVDLIMAKELITERTRAVIAVAVSNVTGAVLPMKELSTLAHAQGAMMVVDAAQAVGHMPVSMQEWNCDALAFGAHKMYGPSGIGALAVSDRLWPRLQPLLLGGGMVDEVDETSIRYLEDVRKFEAGSPNVTGALGFAAAVQFLTSIGMLTIASHERRLTAYACRRLSEVPGIELYGPSNDTKRLGIISFSLSGVHPHDIAEILSGEGVMVRAGYHCAAPLTKCLHQLGTSRISFGLPNTETDVDRLIDALHQVRTLLG